MDQRAEAVPDRIGDDAIDLGFGVDLVVAVDLGHLLETKLARRHGPFGMERGIGMRGPELSGKDARGNANVAHAQADRGNLGLADHVEDPHVVAGMVGHGRDLDDVRIALRKAAVDLVEVVGRLAEVVKADHPFRLAETGYARSNVVFQIDIIDAFGNRRPQEKLPLFLRALPLAAIRWAAAGDDHRARPIGKQPLEIDRPVDIVQPQFDQLGPLLGKVPVFSDHVTVAAAADTDANHG